MKNLLILLAAALAVSACAPTPVSPVSSGPGMSSGAADPDPVDSANAARAESCLDSLQAGEDSLIDGQDLGKVVVEPEARCIGIPGKDHHAISRDHERRLIEPV